MIGALSRIAAALSVVAFGCFASAQTPPDPRATEAAMVRDAFWRAIDAQDIPGAYNMLTTGMQTMVSPQRYTELETQARVNNGASIERRVMRTTVYDNPPNAPAPGVYVAFDFVARLERTDRSCGYIILHQAAEGGPFRVARTEQGYMDNAAAAASEQPVDEAWAQIATGICPGWQRSWAIQPPV